ncbi:LysR family transcriptional regulator [Rhodoligotrophos ferricapiens]|uniref:LysR family transcriptional regulator n=1 Tax=Rhodoligotrophos ferricapiens TaxID=3069264 RepID=UPI00315D846C
MPLSRVPQLTPSDIKLLRLFVKVVENGGFAGAQAELNVSASTISTQMSTLESRLGIRLCDRGRVGFKLTDKGRRIYMAALRLEEALDSIRTDIGELRGKLVGELHVGVVDTTTTNQDCRLHEAIRLFTSRDHSVHINLHVAEPATIEKRLLEGRLHVGISAFYHHVPGLHYEHLFREKHMLYCGRRHRLFNRPAEALSRAEVLDCDFVARGYMVHRQVSPMSGLTAAATAYDMEATLALIRSGAFIGFLPCHYADAWIEKGELKPLLPDEFAFQSDFEFAVRKGLADLRVLNAFLEDLRKAHNVMPALLEA